MLLSNAGYYVKQANVLFSSVFYISYRFIFWVNRDKATKIGNLKPNFGDLFDINFVQNNIFFFT